MKHLRLEVCVETVAALDVAAAGGADRVELCSALNVGGLTPSAGLMAAAASAGIASFVLIRPRAGAFTYSQREIDVMRRDIDQVRSAGLAGVVIGASKANGELDEHVLERLVGHAAGIPCVLHRVFDLVANPSAALEAAIELGFTRILTSGCAPDAPSGMQVIQQLVSQARNRIEIMAGSGIRPDNVAAIIRRTGVQAVHASCSAIVPDDTTDVGKHARALGFLPSPHRATDPAVMAAMLSAMQSVMPPAVVT